MNNAAFSKKSLTLSTFLVLFVVSGIFLSFSSKASAAISDWQRGASIQPTSPTQFGSASFHQSLVNLKADNANYVNLVIPIYQNDIHSSTIFAGGDTPTDSSIQSAISFAHSIGLKVSLKLHIESKDGQWRANIDPTNRASWFANYGSFLVHYATLGQASGTDQLIVGTELVHLSSDSYNAENTADWRALIGQVRSVYSGSLVYAANWGPTGTIYDEKNNIKFWDLLDYAGIDSYYPLGSDASNNSIETFRAYWAQIAQNDIQVFENKVHKPILFTEIGYQSKDGAHVDPGNYQLSGGVNTAEQTNLYQALFQYWNDKSYIVGLHLWDWDASPNAGGPNDNDYTPQGKPAEAVMKQWFGSTGTVSYPVIPVPAAPSFSADANFPSNTSSYQLSLGTNLTFNSLVTDAGGGTGGLLVDTEIYDQNGNKVFQTVSSNQTFAQASTKVFPISWTPTSAGTYTVKIGVFSGDWSRNYLWQGNAGAFKVSAGTPVAPATFNASANAASSTAIVNQLLTLNASVTDTGGAASNILFDLEAYDQNGNKVFQKAFDSLNFSTSEQRNFSSTFTPTTLGTYKLKYGVFSNDWSKNYIWNDNAGSFAVANATTTINPPPPPAPTDTTAPSVSILSPSANMTLAGVSSISAQASDNVGVVGVRFFVDNTTLGNELISTPYSYALDTTVLTNGAHSVIAVARNAAGNRATSSAISFLVLNQVIIVPPPPPAGTSTCSTNIPTNSFLGCYFNDANLSSFKFSRNDSAINFDWGGGSPDSSIGNDNFSVSWTGNFTFDNAEYTFNTFTDDGVRLYIDNQLVLSKWIDQVASYQVKQIMTSGTHTIKVEYYEHQNGARASVNWNRTGPIITTPVLPPADTVAPSVPQNVSAAALSQTQVALAWNASTDNVGVVGYKVYRNGNYVSTPAAASFFDSNLTASTTYSYAVSAVDAANNESAKSVVVQATTPAVVVIVPPPPPLADTTPPVLSAGTPSGTLAAGTISTTLSLSTDENALCRSSTVAGTPYSSMTAFQTTGSKTHSTNVSNLTDGTSYTYYIRCSDTTGNVNTSDYSINFSVASTIIITPPPVASNSIDIWWPTNGATVSGSLPLKVLVENLDVTKYTMYWQVDGGALTAMNDSYSDYQHKESWIDVSGWNTKTIPNYTINFVAKDPSGTILAQKSTTITVTH